MTSPSQRGQTKRRDRRRRTQTLHHEPGAVTWARKKAGLTKRALAQMVGISEVLMGEIESGWRSATPANLAKIATALNCPVVLLERKRPPEPPPPPPGRQQPAAPARMQQRPPADANAAKRRRA